MRAHAAGAQPSFDATFLKEARDRWREIDSALHRLSGDAADPDAYEQLRNALHALKSSAASARCASVEELARAGELRMGAHSLIESDAMVGLRAIAVLLCLAIEDLTAQSDPTPRPA